MDKVCDIMPHFLHDTCMEFVGQVKDQVEKLAEAEPEEACQEVCSETDLVYQTGPRDGFVVPILPVRISLE